MYFLIWGADFDMDGMNDEGEYAWTSGAPLWSCPVNPLIQDSDGDGILDGTEDAGSFTPPPGLPVGPPAWGILDPGDTDPGDDDTDNDGILDGNEDADWDRVVDPGETDPNKFDSDNDGLGDGQEIGLGGPQGTGTNPIPTWDGDSGATTTNPLDDDTDDDG
ncbi:MAG: hypothetical protein NT056_01145, partial [Proteobacteria bacterium]|nr:hypothetical protein [Pseudomonadota bacterium]